MNKNQNKLTTENIEVWKLTKINKKKYACKCHIPKNTLYYIDNDSEDFFTYVSNKLFVEDIGTFVFNKEKESYEFIGEDVETEPIISTNVETILYKKNHLTTAKDGLWSYKKPWQVFWNLVIIKDNKLPKKFLYNNVLYEKLIL